jgi:hypothetical protein
MMKMPPPNSRQRKITNLLLSGASITPQEGITVHGTMRLTVAEISDLYNDLVVRGCAVRVGPRICASEALLARYELLEPSDEPVRPRVPAREMPEFRPLSRRYIPSTRGIRPGSNDMRDVPSHYPPQPVRHGVAA